MRDYEAMGNAMTTALGFENKKVVLYWTAFEEGRFLACELLFKSFEKTLDKQSRQGV